METPKMWHDAERSVIGISSLMACKGETGFNYILEFPESRRCWMELFSWHSSEKIIMLLGVMRSCSGVIKMNKIFSFWSHFPTSTDGQALIDDILEVWSELMSGISCHLAGGTLLTLQRLRHWRIWHTHTYRCATNSESYTDPSNFVVSLQGFISNRYTHRSTSRF